MVNVSADVDIDVLNINKVEPVKRDTCLKNNKVRFKYSLKHICGNSSKTMHRSSKIRKTLINSLPQNFFLQDVVKKLIIPW